MCARGTSQTGKSCKNQIMLARTTGGDGPLLHVASTPPTGGINPMPSAPPLPSSRDEGGVAKLSCWPPPRPLPMLQMKVALAREKKPTMKLPMLGGAAPGRTR